jgi:hypothetical protein
VEVQLLTASLKLQLHAAHGDDARAEVGLVAARRASVVLVLWRQARLRRSGEADVNRLALPLCQLGSMIFCHTEEGRCHEPEKSSNYH